MTEVNTHNVTKIGTTVQRMVRDGDYGEFFIRHLHIQTSDGKLDVCLYANTKEALRLEESDD